MDEILASEDTLAGNEGASSGAWATTKARSATSSNNSGAVVDHRKFDSFGKMTSESAPATDFIFGYTGQALDKATGLYDYWHRWYDPTPGRFLSEDPAASDANLYRYVGNNPLNATDPTGLCGYGSESGYRGAGIYDDPGYSPSVSAAPEPFQFTTSTVKPYNPPSNTAFVNSLLANNIDYQNNLSALASLQKNVPPPAYTVRTPNDAWYPRYGDYPGTGSTYDRPLPVASEPVFALQSDEAMFYATSSDPTSPFLIVPNYGPIADTANYMTGAMGGIGVGIAAFDLALRARRWRLVLGWE